MDRLLLLLLGVLRSACRSRADLVLENAALRHQLGVLMRAGRRPRVTTADRWFWTVLRRIWARWSEVLVFVKPEPVVRWHRAGFCLYWNRLSCITPAMADVAVTNPPAPPIPAPTADNSGSVTPFILPMLYPTYVRIASQAAVWC